MSLVGDAPGGVSHAGRKPRLGDQSDEDEHREVVDAEVEDRGGDEDEHGQLAGQRPGPAEQRELVLGVQVAPREVRDELPEDMRRKPALVRVA